MTIDLYYMPLSGPCRSIQLAAKTLGVDLNLIYTNLKAGEHLTPEFLKINYQHCIPTLNDNGFAIWESRAIVTYLFDKYATSEHESLYPKDPETRAKINRMFYFDMGTLYQRYAEYFYPQAIHKLPADPEKLKRFEEALQYLDTELSGKDFVVGDVLTLADFSLAATVSSFKATSQNISKYENISKWLTKCETTMDGYEEINQKGLDDFAAYMKNM